MATNKQLHANSHKITIFRTGSFLSRAQNKDTDDYFAQSKESIGSYFESQNSHKIGNGLSFKEEDLLMPKLVDREPEDREFKQKVSEYFQDIDTKVPYRGGIELEIGLLESNDKQVTKDNLPINVSDFIRYRHAKGHPQVALSREDAAGNQLIKFYIFDSSEVQAKNTKNRTDVDTAMAIYLKIVGDVKVKEMEEVDQMLTLMGVDPRVYAPQKDKDNLKVEKLRELCETKPKDFYTAYTEGEMEIKAKVKSMVNTGVLELIGDKYMDGESKELVANSTTEMIFMFKDESKSGDVLVLKTRLQEAMKKPMPMQPKKTVV